MNEIRVGIIGAGAIGRDHCRQINNHPQARVTAVADVSRKRAREAGKMFGIDRVCTSWDQLLGEADLDAVSIALPNALHAPAALASLKAGKHVLMDKPFALNAKEAAKVLAAAKKARKVFMLGMNQRFSTQAQTVRTLVERGELGEIYHAKAYWLRRTGSPKFGTWFCRKDLAGGGCMLDIGVHALDMCLYVMDNWKPVSVSGHAYTKLGNRGLGEGGWGLSDRGKRIFDVDDFATALIKFRNGATLQLDASWVLHQETPGRHNVELFGTEGGATVQPPRLFRFGKKRGEYEVVEPQNVPVAYPHGDRYRNWIETILGREKPMCTPAQALTVQKILDGVYTSTRTGKEVRITG